MKVNEKEGTGSLAELLEAISCCCSWDQRWYSFYVDRPFIFLIIRVRELFCLWVKSQNYNYNILK